MNDAVVYYYNFERCEALQLDAKGSNAQAVAAFLNSHSYNKSWVPNKGWKNTLRATLVSNWDHGDGREDVLPGQWVVSQGDNAWIQNEEPARLEKWVFGIQRSIDDEPREMPEDDARFYVDADPEGNRLFRYPVLDNGWRVGPWEPVGKDTLS